MDTDGEYAPATPAAARERYEALGSTSQVVVKEVAKAMDMSAEEYRDRVTSDVVETARDALFASLLAVTVGTRTEYEQWTDDHPEYAVTEVGSEHVDNVAWHAAPAVETVVAATFQDERDAAVGTLRRQAFGRVYRDIVTGEGAGDATTGGDGEGGDAPIENVQDGDAGSDADGDADGG